MCLSSSLSTNGFTISSLSVLPRLKHPHPSTMPFVAGTARVNDNYSLAYPCLYNPKFTSFGENDYPLLSETSVKMLLRDCNLEWACLEDGNYSFTYNDIKGSTRKSFINGQTYYVICDISMRVDELV